MNINTESTHLSKVSFHRQRRHTKLWKLSCEVAKRRRALNCRLILHVPGLILQAGHHSARARVLMMSSESESARSSQHDHPEARSCKADGWPWGSCIAMQMLFTKTAPRAGQVSPCWAEKDAACFECSRTQILNDINICVYIYIWMIYLYIYDIPIYDINIWYINIIYIYTPDVGVSCVTVIPLCSAFLPCSVWQKHVPTKDLTQLGLGNLGTRHWSD